MTDYTTLNDKVTQVLKVTADGEFIWHKDADRLIEEGDYTGIPTMKHILKALRQALEHPEPSMGLIPSEWAGLEKSDIPIDRGAWADVPDATKWVDELRGGDENLEEPPNSTTDVVEPVTWRNAAIRLGEDLYSVGPNGYYDMTASQWLDWALSVVNTAPPKREWVGLTDEEEIELDEKYGDDFNAYIDARDTKLKEKNRD